MYLWTVVLRTTGTEATQSRAGAARTGCIDLRAFVSDQCTLASFHPQRPCLRDVAAVCLVVTALLTCRLHCLMRLHRAIGAMVMALGWSRTIVWLAMAKAIVDTRVPAAQLYTVAFDPAAAGILVHTH